jgi:hypothetical protein
MKKISSVRVGGWEKYIIKDLKAIKQRKKEPDTGALWQL